ncbi:MAG TPA: polyprenyl diphosphate synthase [Thermoplasmata archaeon]|nr:polyprenyl diphosphate synthase [Thermoplasmata archaeon]
MSEPAGRPAPKGPPPYLSQILGSAFRDAQEQRLLKHVRESPLPRHLAIIMDGNRRFAKSHGLLVEQGHEKGRDKLEELLNWCLEIGLRIMTVYALSTENFERPKEELAPLMALFARSFHDIAVDERVHKNKIRVRAFGNRAILPPEVVAGIERAEAATREYDRYFYNVAIAYGGRDEIVLAIRTIAEEVRAGRLRPQDITQEMVSRHLYTADLPDPDLVFRTSGEERISNFLLWQTAYAELYFADVMWPGLSKVDFLRAIRDFQVRQRRYGT